MNPSGKLTETIPLRIQDTPSYGNFPGEAGHVRYGEGIFVGYRGYDLKQLEVAYPFGHGLSYTTFRYGDAHAEVTDAGDIVVTVPVSNGGNRPGREIVQVYTSLPGSAIERAVRALSGFATVEIAPGDEAQVEITLHRNDLTAWDVRQGRWVLEGGDYTIEVGASSRDIRATTTVTVAGDDTSVPLTLHSSVTDVLADPVAGPPTRKAMGSFLSGDEASDAATLKAMEGFPVGRIVGFTGPEVTVESLQTLLDEANAAARPATKS
ncbi:fibronectin type III-like domain-contianing protein [Microbacterium sp. bgisy203]|uniref:fibronectin type III-like domain-contianing protein n=1 Tax=Microbacterium sp. bgisy203 TaxID=3413799 RepID=UPI003D7416FB